MSLLKVLNNKKKENKKMQRISSAKKIGSAGAAGLLLGLAAGMLFAPKSGEETRNQIKDSKDKVTDYIKTKKEKFTKEDVNEVEDNNEEVISEDINEEVNEVVENNEEQIQE